MGLFSRKNSNLEKNIEEKMRGLKMNQKQQRKNMLRQRMKEMTVSENMQIR